MPVEILTIPCRADNYAYLIHDTDSGATACVDVPDAAPIEAALAERKWPLDTILITHHHDDHISGVASLKAKTGARTVGNAADAARLPALDQPVAAGDRITVAGQPCDVIDVSGHTIGHIAFHLPEAGAAFTADSLMALGCGRVFEGTPEMMWDSLSRLAALPPETKIYSGHEYTAANARFALTIEPDNADLRARAEEISERRAAGEPTVPATLDTELRTNPFLRARLPEVKALIGRPVASDAEAFAEIRGRKDRF